VAWVDTGQQGWAANKLVEVMAQVLQQGVPERQRKEILNKSARCITIDEELLSEIEAVTDKRGVPDWVRSAIKFASENSVPPEWLAAESDRIISRRKTIDDCRTLTIPLGKTLLKVVEILAKRARLSDKEVIEACVGFYHTLHSKASELP